ncbi:hypothetical protein B0H16DRAFT_1454684 [Mycena metata]|uniref:Uncharacterized protein n=1 Tax=Mycena metata TaxID=1033252 RepID=A0AAD7JHF7_9AGAR|nr:hypothetical protein B0H16DRAFT_1454684 [Mycena metata]
MYTSFVWSLKSAVHSTINFNLYAFACSRVITASKRYSPTRSHSSCGSLLNSDVARASKNASAAHSACCGGTSVAETMGSFVGSTRKIAKILRCPGASGINFPSKVTFEALGRSTIEAPTLTTTILRRVSLGTGVKTETLGRHLPAIPLWFIHYRPKTTGKPAKTSASKAEADQDAAVHNPDDLPSGAMPRPIYDASALAGISWRVLGMFNAPGVTLVPTLHLIVRQELDRIAHGIHPPSMMSRK